MATVNGRAVLQETFFKAYVEDNELMTEWMIVEEGGGGLHLGFRTLWNI